MILDLTTFLFFFSSRGKGPSLDRMCNLSKLHNYKYCVLCVVSGFEFEPEPEPLTLTFFLLAFGVCVYVRGVLFQNRRNAK